MEAEIARVRPGTTPAVPSSVLEELDRLVERGTPDAAGARRFADRFPRAVSSGRGDDAIVRTAVRHNAIVATADRELRADLTARGIEVLSPRDRHRLELHSGRVSRPGRRRGSANR